jgi:hypothetical protein
MMAEGRRLWSANTSYVRTSSGDKMFFRSCQSLWLFPLRPSHEEEEKRKLPIIQPVLHPSFLLGGRSLLHVTTRGPSAIRDRSNSPSHRIISQREDLQRIFEPIAAQYEMPK